MFNENEMALLQKIFSSNDFSLPVNLTEVVAGLRKKLGITPIEATVPGPKKAESGNKEVK